MLGEANQESKRKGIPGWPGPIHGKEGIVVGRMKLLGYPGETAPALNHPGGFVTVMSLYAVKRS